MNPSEKGRLLVARNEGIAYIRVEGPATFRDCPALRNFVETMRDDGVRQFHFLLDQCSTLDSTFLGTIAGIRLRVGAPRAVVIRSANDKVQSILQTMGLDQLVTYAAAAEAAEETPLATLPHQTVDRDELRRLMIEAHEDLGNIDQSNQTRFQSVVDFLRSGGRKPDAGDD
jgi:hypothetical protein